MMSPNQRALTLAADFKECIAALNASEVTYILVGRMRLAGTV
jgi:hypothetical protein